MKRIKIIRGVNTSTLCCTHSGAVLACVAYQLVRYLFPDYLLLVSLVFVLCCAVLPFLIITILNLAAPDYQSTLRFKHKANKQWFYLDCTSIYAHNSLCFFGFSYQFTDIHLYCHAQKATVKLLCPRKPKKIYALPMHHSLCAR